MQRIIDLTLTLRPGMRGVEMEPKYTFERDGWNASTLHLYSHCGTHMDSPKHFQASEQTIEQIPLESCMGPAWVVRLPGTGPQALIGIEQLGRVADLLRPGDSLLLHTGWSAYVDEPKYRDGLPRISRELAQWCVQRRVRMLGVEPPSVADVNNLPEVTEIHQILLGGDVVIVEGLTNLDAIRRERIWFAALPLKVQRGDGAPARAMAVESAGDGPEWWERL
jgi:arylformamidase